MLCEIISETKGTIINLPIQSDINVSRDDYIEINNVRYVVRRKEYILKTERNTGSIILIMIVATICLIKVIRAAKKSD